LKLSSKLPEHENLGELIFLEEDNEGDKLYYRECLTLWSKEEQLAYEKENDRTCGFHWQVYGMNPIFGVSAWLLKGEEI
tara:strand:+ start:12246 stop:12482 length:237 start_codon:yes stop_codon:yes gene_type:complete